MQNFSNSKIISKAPGRVCLFGDHQDYLGLPIIACAIDRYVEIEGIENNKKTFQIDLPDMQKTLSIPLRPDEKVKNDNHLIAVLKVLRGYNCIPNKGYDLTIRGNIPINAGLSSSSAVVVAWINFLVNAFGTNQKITPELTAKIAYEAEVLEVGGSGGKMDQYSISIGEIIYLETAKVSYFEKLKVPKMSMIIGESGIPKATSAILKDRKENAQKAINMVKEKFPDFSIRDVQVSEINNYIKVLPHNLHCYFEATVLNFDITKRALVEFKKDNPDIEILGKLMNEHHSILKSKLDLSVPRIDDMINAAMDHGAWGAKIVGSGKGGSIVAISAKKDEERIVNAMKKAEAKNAYTTQIAAGASVLKPKE